MEMMEKRIGLFLSCGSIYYLIECIFHYFTNGLFYSHWTMFILAGLLGVLCIDTPNNIYSFELGYVWQILISTILCTIGEGICGLIVNVWWGLNVWDYSNLWGTFFFGQCNILFMFAWALIIGCIGIFYCDYYNYYICGIEPCPYYKFRGKVFLRFKEKDKKIKERE